MNNVLRLFVIGLYAFSLVGNPLSFAKNRYSLRDTSSQSQIVRPAGDLAVGTSRTEHFAPLAAVPGVTSHAYSTPKNTELSIAAPGVLTGASDSDGHPLTAAVAKNPAHGTLALNPDGSFTYLPDTGFSDKDSFTYTASDNIEPPNVSAEATVQIDVINAVPVGNGDSYSIAEDQPLLISAPGVLENDTDTDLDPLAAVLVAGPSHGDLTLNPDGSFTYLVDANYNGADTFTYKASDGQNESGAATVDITIDSVNDTPQAADDNYSTNEDAPLTVSKADGVLGNDTDADQEPLTAVIAAGPAHGTVTLNGDGSFLYTPATDYDQPDSFTYTASDGKVTSAPATVHIAVSPVNDAPVAQADSYNAVEDQVFTVSAPGILANDTDVDSPITAIQDSDPAHGALIFNANGSFTYTPGANWNGGDSFSYHVTDGPNRSATVTVNLTVTATNDLPTANNDTYTATEDTTLSVTAAEGVLANDTDVESSTLTAIINANASHGTVTLNADGSFSYAPAADYNGPDSFTYHAYDGTDNSAVATVNITVTAVNDSPVAVADNYSINEDATFNLPAKGVLANDTDVDKDTLHALVNETTANGALTLNSDGSLTYRPTANFAGPDTFTYHANDGQANSNVVTVTITVNPVNDAPTAVNDTYSTDEDTALNQPAPGVLTNDSDVDGNPLKAVLVAGPSHGTLTLNQDGSFIYNPTANYNGPDSFTYRANDGTVNSNVATVTMTVNPVNDRPVAVNDSFTTDEDTQLTAVPSRSVLTNDSDVDHDVLTVTLDQDVAHGSLTLNADGTFSYLPDANYNGQDTFTYYASDKDLSSAVATVTLRINPENDPPVAVGDSYSTNEDKAIITAAPGVLANDTDVENDSLTAKVATGPSYGALTLNANGSFTYTPRSNYFGLDSFTYKASDGQNESGAVTVSIEITPVNDAPVANVQTASVDEDGAINLILTGSDVENDILSYIITDQPAHGTLTQTGIGPSVRYTPNPDFDQQDTFKFKVNDGHLDSPVATVTITVRPVNDPPVGVPESYSIDEDKPLSVPAPDGVRANDTDIDNNLSELSVALITGPTKGTLSLSSDGSFTYTPTLNLNGPDSFVYRVYDGKAWAVSPTTVNITINPVNDAPVAAADPNYEVTEQIPAPGQDTTVVSFNAAVGVLANDTDVENTPLQVVMPTGKDSDVIETEYATITLHKQGNFEYKQRLKDAQGKEIEFPGANPTGKITFSYQVTDGELNSATVTVTITVLGVNDKPKINPIPDLFINREGIREVPAPGLLKGASDPEKSPLIAAKVGESYRVDCWTELDDTTGQEYRVCEPWRNQKGDIIYMGTAMINPDGSYSFVTEPGTVGYFEIDFKVCDDGAGDASGRQIACTPNFIIVNVENNSLLKVTWVSPVQNDAWYRIDSPTVTLRFYPEILPNDQGVIEDALCEPSCEIRIDFYDTTTGRFKRLGVIDWKDPVFDLDPTNINLHWNEVTAALVNPITGEASPHASIFPLRLPGSDLPYHLFNPLNFTRTTLNSPP